MTIKTTLAAAAIVLSATAASAAPLIEQFDSFPAWESGWLGTNSNIQNFYGVGMDRGNQAYGLWVQDTVNDSTVDVMFNALFGASLTSFAMDVASFVNNTLEIYDIGGNVLGTFSNFTNSSYTTAVNVGVTSTNGIGGFRFSSAGTAGNTWIDNVTVDANPAPVPLPAALPMLLAALAGSGIALRRRKGA